MINKIIKLPILILILLLNIHFYQSKLISISKRALVGSKWPSNKIAYDFSNKSDFDDDSRTKIELILKSMENLLNVDGKTCIEFVRRHDEKDFILFVDNGDCSSTIGYNPGMNRVSLANNCINTGLVMHEMMHRLGFDHEHSRPDRNEFVDVFVENIKSGTLDNFVINLKKKEENTEKSPYDFHSITHYNSNGLQKNSDASTIISKYPSLLTKNKIDAEKESMSKIDIYQMQSLFQCETIKAHPINKPKDDEDFKRKEQIIKRFELETAFMGLDKDLVNMYIEKTFDTCGMNSYWPFDYPLVKNDHKQYELICQEKKNNDEDCKFSLECKDEEAVCIRIFFKKTGICFKTQNKKVNEISQKINDQMFDKGKKLKETGKVLKEHLVIAKNIMKDSVKESFSSLKKIFG